MRVSPVICLMLVVISSTMFNDSTAVAGNCGREEPTTPDPGRFKDNGDGTLNDKDQNVMWKQCIEGLRGIRCRVGRADYFNWVQAQRKADKTVFAGYDDWRIPTDKELRSLIEPGCQLPAINLAWFPRTPTGAFWFHSPEADNSFRAGAVSFAYGENLSYDQKNVLYLRLVRSLPPSTANQPAGNNSPAPANNNPPAIANTPPTNPLPTGNQTPPANNNPPAAANTPPTNPLPTGNQTPPANNNPPAAANTPPTNPLPAANTNQPPAGAP